MVQENAVWKMPCVLHPSLNKQTPFINDDR